MSSTEPTVIYAAIGSFGLLCAAGAVLALPGAARAADAPVEVTAEFDCKISDVHALPVEGQPDHVVVLDKYTCAVRGSGNGAMFDGAQEIGSEEYDLTKGSGTIHGYSQGRAPDGSTYRRAITGEVTARSADGESRTVIFGVWHSMAGGTGRFANEQSAGTFQAMPTGPGEARAKAQRIVFEGGK